MATLHITNGDSVGGTLGDLSNDPVLPWRDVLHEGPVPGDVDAQKLRETRARFLADDFGVQYDLVLADITGRDAQVAAMGANDHIVLWFEPDLYDQLQLLQILAQLYLKPVANRPRVTIVEADELLGTLKPNQLAKYHDQQRDVRDVDFELAAEGWEAFTSSNDTLLKQFANTETALHAANSYASDSAVVLPYVHAAIRRMLQEYPSPVNGLSRSEQQILDVLLQGPRTMGETYQQSHAPKEEWIWLGDTTFVSYVERMADTDVPLIEFDGAAGDTGPDAERDRWDMSRGAAFWSQKIRLTKTGEVVAKGEANAVDLNGIDRWIGGVHLQQSPTA